MRQFKYVITDPVGIHARPAGLLSKEAEKYSSTIFIIKGEKKVETKRIIALMALAVKQGEEVTLEIEGKDEDEAFESLKTFFEKNL